MNFYYVILLCFFYCICKIEYLNEMVLFVCYILYC